MTVSTAEIIARLRDVEHGHTAIGDTSDLPKLAADEIERMLAALGQASQDVGTT